MWTLSGLRGAPVLAPSARARTPRSVPAFPLVAAASLGPGVAAPGARPPAVTAQWSCRPRPPPLSCPPGPSCGSCTCCVCPPPIVGPRGCPLWLRPPYRPQWGLPSCFYQENLPASTLALSALPGAPPARPRAHRRAHLTPCHVLLVKFIPPPRVLGAGPWAASSPPGARPPRLGLSGALHASISGDSAQSLAEEGAAPL